MKKRIEYVTDEEELERETNWTVKKTTKGEKCINHRMSPRNRCSRCKQVK